MSFVTEITNPKTSDPSCARKRQSGIEGVDGPGERVAVANPRPPPSTSEEPTAFYTICTPEWFVLRNGQILLSSGYTRTAFLVVSTLFGLLLFHYWVLPDYQGYINSLFFRTHDETIRFESGGTLSRSIEGVMSVMDEIERNNTVMFTLANPAFDLFLENWDCYAKPFVGRRFLVYTTDYDFGQRISEQAGYHVLVERSDLNGALKFGTTAYQQLILARTQLATRLLDAGKSVFIVDTDEVWLSDPFPYLESTTDVDIVTERDGSTGMEEIICGGFLLLKNTPTTKRVWGEVTRRHEEILANAVDNITTGGSEQMVINEIYNAERRNSSVEELRRRGLQPLRVHFLDGLLFANGAMYFWKMLPQQQNVTPVMIHNNWIIGSQSKMDRFKAFGLWAVAADDVQGAGGRRCTIGT
ncbi:unnamed protein product [Calypogeia fissa]